jgi:zinc protease
MVLAATVVAVGAEASAVVEARTTTKAAVWLVIRVPHRTSRAAENGREPGAVGDRRGHSFRWSNGGGYSAPLRSGVLAGARFAVLLAMREIRFFLVMALSGACSKVEESSYSLANGLKVDVVDAQRGDRVAVLVSYELGLDYDPEGRSGMSNLLSRLLPTCAVPGKPVRQDGLVVRSGSDHLTMAVAVPLANLDEELDDFAARMGGLQIGDADLERERPALLEELARLRGGDAALAAMSFAAEAIRPSRGGWRGGVPREIEKISADEAEAFWREHGKPANARLVIVGDVDPARVRARIEAAFGKIPAGSAAPRRAPAASTVTGTLVMGDQPSALALAVGVPAPSEALYPAFLILAARLSSASHSWKVSFSPLEQPEVLLVTGSLEPEERPDDAAARIHKEISALTAAGPSSSELRAAPATFAASLGTAPLKPEACAHDPVRVAFVKARSAQLHVDGHGLGQALETVTAAQLAEAARLFEPQRTPAVVAGGAIPSP